MSATGTGTAAVERPTAVTVLVVDDEDAARNLCRGVVMQAGLRTRTASTTEQAIEILDQYPVDSVLTDLRVPQMGGIELLKCVRATYPQTAVIVLTQYGTIEGAIEATRMGAAEHLLLTEKPDVLVPDDRLLADASLGRSLRSSCLPIAKDLAR